MRRRTFIAGAVALVASPIAAGAQTKIPTIGVLVAGTPDPAPFLSGFKDGLRSRGYIDRRNVILDIRSAGGRPERLDGLAHDLAAAQVDVIVCFQTPTCEAAAHATRQIPIVGEAGDMVGTGLVHSLARPGDNVTGVSGATAETAAKNIEVIREILPGARRIGALCNASDPFSKPFLVQLLSAAHSARVDIVPSFARGPAEMEAAFMELVRKKVDAVVVQPSLGAEGPARLAMKLHVPAASPNRPFARTGGLISYSANQPALYRKVAAFVDKVLKGAKPADLPVEQPTTFDLLINLETAKALGLTIPTSLLTTANEVIE